MREREEGDGEENLWERRRKVGYRRSCRCIGGPYEWWSESDEEPNEEGGYGDKGIGLDKSLVGTCAMGFDVDWLGLLGVTYQGKVLPPLIVLPGPRRLSPRVRWKGDCHFDMFRDCDFSERTALRWTACRQQNRTIVLIQQRSTVTLYLREVCDHS